VYVINAILINVIFCILLQGVEKAYLFYVFKSLVVYLELPMIIAILLGGVVSYVWNSLAGYSTLAILAFYFAIRQYQLFYAGETLFGVSDFSQLFCVSARYGMQYGALYPLELHFIVKPLYLIGFLLLILSGIYWKKSRKAIFVWGEIVAFAMIIVGVALWKMPCGGCYYGYEDAEEQLYENEINEEENNFYVEKYDIDIDFAKGMEVTVGMTLSDSELSEYDFTFLDEYSITRVEDEKGESLEFTQENNVLRIVNKNMSVKELVVSYTGKNLNRYCFGKTSIYLPGNYPYYPIAGIWQIGVHGLCQLPKQESVIHVSIKNHKNSIYTNLEQTADCEWEGTSNNLTIVSGYWREKEIQGIDFIYPYVSAYYNPELNSYLLDGVLEYCEMDGENDYSINGKKVLIAPFAYEMGNYMFGSDMVIIGNRNDLEQYYMNYITTGNWHKNEESTDEEIQQVLEDNPL
jgi:hypothetical protein